MSILSSFERSWAFVFIITYLCLFSFKFFHVAVGTSENEHVLLRRTSDLLFTDLNIPLSQGQDYMFPDSDMSQCSPCTNITTGMNITFENATCRSIICFNLHAVLGVTNLTVRVNDLLVNVNANTNSSRHRIFLNSSMDITKPVPVRFQVFRKPCFGNLITSTSTKNSTVMQCAHNETLRASVCFNVTGDVDDLRYSSDYLVTGDNECSINSNIYGMNLGCSGSFAFGNKPICSRLNVTLDTNYNDENGTTNFCYTIQPNGQTNITHFNLNFPNASQALNFTPGVNFKAAENGYWTVIPDYLQFVFTPPISNSPRTACFRLPDRATELIDRRMDLKNDYERVCLVTVKGPGVRINPVNVCGLDPNVENASCNDCLATCQRNSSATITGSQLCRLKTLTSTTYPGLNCTRFSTRSCTRTCPIDCTSEGPNWLKCTSNCRTKTVTQTGFFTVVTPQVNGGAPCGSLVTTRLCSIPPDSKECPPDIDCVVTGIPTRGCADVCTRGGPNIVTATFDYPITLTPPSGNGNECRNYTTTCSCSACALDSTAYETSPCTATCSKNDGSFVNGTQKLVYSVLTPALNAAPCATAIERACTSRCSCDYQTSFSLNSCIHTSTLSSQLPWTAIGVQNWTAIGFTSACNTYLNLPCQTVLPPVDCVPTYSCQTAQCTPTFGADFVLNTVVPCSTATLTASSYGGNTCNPIPTATSFSRLCPGCNYNWICGCAFTSSTSSFGTTRATGTVVCTGKIDANANVPAFCSPTYVSSHATSACETTIRATTCAYSTVGCENDCSPTATSSATLPWTLYGKNLCTYSDARDQAQRPSTCTQYTSSASCSRTLQPINCATTNICLTSRPICSGTQPTEVTLRNVNCRVVTLATPQFGGSTCPPFSTFRGNAVATCSVTTSTPTPTGYFDQANLYNAVFFDNANCAGSSVDGRLAVGGDASLINFMVGQSLSLLNGCNQYPSEALRVGGSLTYLGSVKNGDARVSGSCNDGIDSSCKLSCNEANAAVCEINPFRFDALKTKISLLSQSLTQRPATVTVGTYFGNTVSIGWSGNAIESIVIPATASSPLLPWNSYTGLLSQTATVIITVYGDRPILTGFDLSYFSERAPYVLWNFPEASVVEINAMTVYGSVIAPNAELRGSGTIVGQVIAGSLMCSDNQALKIQDAPFKGTL